MTRALLAALGLVVVVIATGCGSSSMNDLVRDRFGEGAGSCKPAAATELGKLYSCQNGNGGTICLSRDGDDLFIATPAQLEQLQVSC